ncbi:MAG: hypothetical protein ABI824_20385 [Acidobacteriota bacterium]
MSLLVAHSAAVSLTNDLGESALMWAARTGNPYTIKVLLGGGADPKQADKTDHNAIFYLKNAMEELASDRSLVERYSTAEAILQKR